MRRNSRLSLILAVASLGAGSMLWGQNPSSPTGSSQGAPSGQTGAPGAGPTSAGPMSERSPMDAPMQTRVDDKKFLKDATMGGLTEVELGKLAAEKGSSDAVKQFGQKLAQDHGQANELLKQIAAKENVEAPASLDSKHQSRVDKLSKLSGPEFDKAFVKDQVKDHQKDISDFQAEAQYGSDPNVKAAAAKLLPTLQQHLEQAKDLSKQTTARK